MRLTPRIVAWLVRLGPLVGFAAVVLLFSALRPAQFATPANAGPWRSRW